MLPSQYFNTLLQCLFFSISAENIKCEYVNHFQKYCYCAVTASNGVNRMITLNGTTCGPRNECLKDNGGCAHLCVDQTVGFRCSCFPKPADFPHEVWTLSDNGYDCNDVNECADRTFVDEFCASPGKRTLPRKARIDSRNGLSANSKRWQKCSIVEM